jgi:hypothetical protein
MPRILAILLVLAVPALAESRKAFPDDFVPSPCASAAEVCTTFNQSQFADYAALRGFDIGQEWADAHWRELGEALAPACAKLATCYATNDPRVCNDIVAEEVYATTCDRYPEGSVDREKCAFFVRIYLVGVERKSREAWQKIRECAKAQPAAAGERTLEWWLSPAKIDANYEGSFRVFAIDSKTRVPVLARVHMDVKPTVYANDAPGGLPTTFYAVPWKAKLVRVPNDEGHRDVVPPEVRLEAPGYEPVTFRLPMDIPTMTITMEPAATALEPGKHTVTIRALDAATGEPVEARVMGGEHVLGKTNVPFELEVPKDGKRPEIWVTSLYDRYDDVVVVPASVAGSR